MKHENQIRLHKITSNKPVIMESFDVNEHGELLKEIDRDNIIHRSLGLFWNLKDEIFFYGADWGETSYLLWSAFGRKQPIRFYITKLQQRLNSASRMYTWKSWLGWNPLLKTFTSGKRWPKLEKYTYSSTRSLGISQNSEWRHNQCLINHGKK